MYSVVAAELCCRFEINVNLREAVNEYSPGLSNEIKIMFETLSPEMTSERPRGK